MKSLAVIYHGAHGNTERIANLIADGAAQVEGVRVQLMRAEDLVSAPQQLVAARVRDAAWDVG